MVNTPYDDVFRTLLTDCTALIIPVVNELFHTSYTGKETIHLLQNEQSGTYASKRALYKAAGRQ